MTTLKHISDGMLVLAFVFLGVGFFVGTWGFWVSGFCLLDSIVAVVVRRRMIKARKAPAA